MLFENYVFSLILKEQIVTWVPFKHIVMLLEMEYQSDVWINGTNLCLNKLCSYIKIMWTNC